ncbi:hypothetical protein M011DRAFT_457082 [Sporormia fimetaria CBS 119925]|uniref:Uncharacterized protein n=1 Tax=Sporormia fimetaria CBS 119925 TaxID=1340428 RepID=A0A6A6VHB4_9PLEO|nr:hypothetical protein M011DRAFT_457082 [Sporormia fimetaria CBS 119925]
MPGEQDAGRSCRRARWLKLCFLACKREASETNAANGLQIVTGRAERKVRATREQPALGSVCAAWTCAWILDQGGRKTGDGEGGYCLRSGDRKERVCVMCNCSLPADADDDAAQPLYVSFPPPSILCVRILALQNATASPAPEAEEEGHAEHGVREEGQARVPARRKTRVLSTCPSDESG